MLKGASRIGRDVWTGIAQLWWQFSWKISTQHHYPEEKNYITDKLVPPWVVGNIFDNIGRLSIKVADLAKPPHKRSQWFSERRNLPVSDGTAWDKIV